LVQATQAGKTEAFSELVRRHERKVYQLSHQFMRNPAVAEDMAQEAFLKAFRLLRGYRGDCRFSTWLYRVTCSVCLTELKRQGRRREVPLEVTYLERKQAPDHDDPEKRDLRSLVRRCVGELSERYGTIIALYYLEGASYDDIAAAMDIPMGTLKTWMHRARRELRNLVEKELQDDVHPS